MTLITEGLRGQCQRRIDGGQNEGLTFELASQILDDSHLRLEEILAIDGHLLPVLTSLDVDLWHSNLIEHLYKVHVGGTIEVLVILYGLASEFVLEVEEESCRHILVGTTLVEHLKDAFTLAVSYLRLCADGLYASCCEEHHGEDSYLNLFHILSV